MKRLVLSPWRWLAGVGMVLVLFSAACVAPRSPEMAAPPAITGIVEASPGATATAGAVTPDPAATAVASREATAGAEETAPPPAATATPTPAPPTPTLEPTPTVATLAPFDPALAATLQQILDEMVADGYIPGTVLSVSVPGHEPWTGASGVADRQTQRPMEPDTYVRIASISKIFTAVVVLQLIEEGVIKLDAPLSTYLPGLIPRGDATSVRDLLRHTTGLYDYLQDPNYLSSAYQNPQREWEPRELVTYATQFPLAFEPHAPGSWAYSSTNYVILGMVVEQVTGNTLAQEMRQRVFEPLGLEQTYFPSDEAVPDTAARGYWQTMDQTNLSLSFAYATANLVSTADDVRRFGEGLVNGELLQPETLEEMFTFVSGQGWYNMPELEYGLGIMRNRLPAGVSPAGLQRPASASIVVGHIGGFGGFRSAVWSAPEGGITIALAMNQLATDPNILAQRVFDAILTAQESVSANPAEGPHGNRGPVGFVRGGIQSSGRSRRSA